MMAHRLQEGEKASECFHLHLLVLCKRPVRVGLKACIPELLEKISTSR